MSCSSVRPRYFRSACPEKMHLRVSVELVTCKRISLLAPLFTQRTQSSAAHLESFTRHLTSREKVFSQGGRPARTRAACARSTLPQSTRQLRWPRSQRATRDRAPAPAPPRVADAAADEPSGSVPPPTSAWAPAVWEPGPESVPWSR